MTTENVFNPLLEARLKDDIYRCPSCGEELARKRFSTIQAANVIETGYIWHKPTGAYILPKNGVSISKNSQTRQKLEKEMVRELEASQENERFINQNKNALRRQFRQGRRSEPKAARSCIQLLGDSLLKCAQCQRVVKISASNSTIEKNSQHRFHDAPKTFT